MNMEWKTLSAAEELEMERQAVKTFGYLVQKGGTAERSRLEAIWAAANHAALIAAASVKHGKRIYRNGIHAAKELGLEELVRLAEQCPLREERTDIWER